jgi:hypothetical protein
VKGDWRKTAYRRNLANVKLKMKAASEETQRLKFSMKTKYPANGEEIMAKNRNAARNEEE